ncbi:MAG TPA: ribbon-helix-helix protein, CopG family [Archaeoglobaceae archaeon]|nr:ribbon-helix-helix protein, CopG family [Archaeoglobaceae archaeon]
MKNPRRVTIAFDEESYEIFNRLRDKLRKSQSEIVRNALKFYYDYREFESFDRDIIRFYVDMLSEGEHIILDVDHWIAFLKLVETHPEKEEFWRLHKEVARSHAEQFKGKSAEYILHRLEACNFFRVNRVGESEYTLIFGNDLTKEFIRAFLEEVFEGLGMRTDVKEDLTKLRIKL